MDIKNVRKWVREFMYRCIDIHDEQHSVQPSVSVETIAKVEQEMLKDRHLTVRELCKQKNEVKHYLRNVVGEFYNNGI